MPFGPRAHVRANVHMFAPMWTIRVPPLRSTLKCSTRASKGSPQQQKAPEEHPKEPLRKQPRHASRNPLSPTKRSAALAPGAPQGDVAPLTPPRQKVQAASWRRTTPQRVETKVSKVDVASPLCKPPQKLPAARKVASEASESKGQGVFTPRGALPSWLGKKRDAEGRLFGCTVCAACAAAGGAAPDAFARFALRAAPFFRPSSFKRHARTKFHKAAMKAHLRKYDETFESVGAPPAKEFVAVWRASESRGRPHQAEAKARSARKLNTLEWCLWQAKRDEERAFLATADTISIQMDERKARTLLTYAACKRIKVSRGVLAQFRRAGRDAEEIASLVRRAVRHFCTFGQHHPCTNRGRARPQLDRKAMYHIIRNIEMFSADGASSEQLAGRLLHPRVERAGTAEKLPRLKMILRDKAHSVRRLTQRTFKVDPVLNGILDELVTGQRSIAEMLHLSEPCSKVFREELKRREKPSDAPGATVHDLSWAKHRFDGVAKPLGVCVWNLDAVISTSTIIERDANFGAEYRKSCRKFLDGLCPEKIILMGMMADASDEVLTLCRFFDREAFETDQMAAQIVAFKARVRLLFREEACLSQGFTRTALGFLETPRMVRDGMGAMKTVSGPSPDQAAVTKACLLRMVAWSDLAEEVANTEFPDFELLGSFQIFRLHFQDVRLKRQRGCLPPEPAEDHPKFDNGCLAHLAGAFAVDPNQLRTEFLDHRALAQAEKQQHPELSAVVAWQRVLERTQANWHSRKRWSATALLPILQRFFLCPGSTAGIEQKFSQNQRMMNAQYNASALVEERRFVSKLNAEATKEPPPGLVASARRIWVKYFGASRTSSGRTTLGVRTTLRLKKARAQSGAGWLAQRRQELGAAVAAQKPCPSGTPRLLTARDKGPKNAAWTKKHEAEAQHQKKERLKRACAATEEGTAKGSAVSAKELEDFRKAERKAASELGKKRRRHLAILAEPKRMDIDGKRVFVDGSALEELDKLVGAWAALRVKRHLRPVVERQQAAIIVVSNPAEPGDRNGVVASMLGLRLCTPCFLASGKGTALQLQTALQVHRYIFISAACQAKHTVILNLMQSVSRDAKKSGWLFFGPCTTTVFLRGQRDARKSTRRRW